MDADQIVDRLERARSAHRRVRIKLHADRTEWVEGDVVAVGNKWVILLEHSAGGASSPTWS